MFDTIAGDLFVQTPDVLLSNNSMGTQTDLRLAALPNGGFIACWHSDSGIEARFFDADGNPVGSSFPIATGADYDPSVALLPDGNIVVSWTPLLSATPWIYEIHARICDSTGQPVGNEFTVNTYNGSPAGPSHIVSLTGGGFAVAWDEYYGGPGDVRVQIFSADGSKVGGEIVATAPVQTVSGGSSIAALTGGGFVVTWSQADPVPGGGPYDPTIHAQVFDASGTKIGGILTINSYAPGSQGAATVTSLPGGGFVVAWNDTQTPFDPAHDGVWFQRFDSSGARVGNEVHVTDGGLVTGFMRTPSVQVVPGVGLFVIWQQSDVPGAWMPNLHGQLFDFNGQSIGTEFVLAANAAGIQQLPDVALLLGGPVVVGWTNSVSNPDDSDVRAEILFPLIKGTNAADVLTGGDHKDFIDGAGGDDQITAGLGDDQIDGGTGADVMAGGGGNDTYYVDNASDIVVENTNEGADNIIASVSHTLETEVEQLTLTGAAAIDGVGNGLANILIGNVAGNILSGGGGDDFLTGNAGIDILTGGAGNDTFKDNASGLNGDTITDFSRGDRIVISDATLAGFTFSLSGNQLTFTGGSLTLSNLNFASITASAAPEGGVQITFSGPPIILSAGSSVTAAAAVSSSAQSAEATAIAPAMLAAAEQDLRSDRLDGWHAGISHWEAMHAPEADLFALA